MKRTGLFAGACFLMAGLLFSCACQAVPAEEPAASGTNEANEENEALQTEVYVLDNAYANSVRIELHPEDESSGIMYYMFNDAMTSGNTAGMRYICSDGKMYVMQTEAASEPETEQETELYDVYLEEEMTEGDTREEKEAYADSDSDDVPDGYTYWGVKTDQYLLTMPADTISGDTSSSGTGKGWFEMYTECYASSASGAGNPLFTVTWYHADGTFEQVNLFQGRSGQGTYQLAQNFLILREKTGTDQDHLNEYHYYVHDGIIYQTVYLKQSNINMP